MWNDSANLQAAMGIESLLPGDRSGGHLLVGWFENKGRCPGAKQKPPIRPYPPKAGPREPSLKNQGRNTEKSLTLVGKLIPSLTFFVVKLK